MEDRPVPEPQLKFKLHPRVQSLNSFALPEPHLKFKWDPSCSGKFSKYEPVLRLNLKRAAGEMPMPDPHLAIFVPVCLCSKIMYFTVFLPELKKSSNSILSYPVACLNLICRD